MKNRFYSLIRYLLSFAFIIILLAGLARPQSVKAQDSDEPAIWVGQNSNTNDNLRSIYFVDSDTGWAAGRNGKIVHTIDGGESWTNQNSTTSDELMSIHFVDADTGWAVGKLSNRFDSDRLGTRYEDIILHTVDGGQNWTEQTSNIRLESEREVHLYSINFVNADTGWAVGEKGKIIQTTYGGVRDSWSEQTSNTSETLFSVYFPSADTGWAAGGNGTILRTTDGGQNWTEQTSNTSETIFSVYFASVDTGWATGNNGMVLRTTDGGQNWNQINSGTTEHLRSIFFTDADTGLVTGYNGTILKTTDGGENWFEQTSNTTDVLYSAFFADSAEGWVAGSNGTILDQVILNVPEISAPVAQSDLEPPVSLEWDPELNSEHLQFNVHLSTKPDFSDTLRLETDYQNSFLDLTQSDSLPQNQTYYWRVRRQSIDHPEVASAWESSDFNIVIDSPVLQSPFDQEEVDAPVTLSWDPELNSNFQFKVQLSTKSDFSSLVRNDSTTNSSYSPGTIKTNETYHWRVRREGTVNTNYKSEWKQRSFFLRPDFVRLEKDSSEVFTPHFVSVRFHTTDQDNKGVTGLDKPDFRVLMDGEDITGTSEADYDIDPIDQVPFNIPVVILLDNSSSLAGDLDEVKTAAKEFIRSKTDAQEITIYTFSDGNKEIIGFERDTTKLLNAVDAIELGFNTTDLYGSTIEMYDKWQDESTLSKINQGYLIVFTDGDDTSGRATLEEVINKRESKQVFTVGFGPDIDPDALQSMGNAGSFIESDINNLGNIFKEVQEDLLQLSDSFYWLIFDSPKRGDFDRTLEIQYKNNTNTGSDSYIFEGYNSKDFYSTKPEILVNATNDNRDGVDTLSIAADDTVNVRISFPFNYQVQPLVFDISEPTKLFIEPDSLYSYTFIGNGQEGDTLSVTATDTVVVDQTKNFTVIFTAPKTEPKQPTAARLSAPPDSSTGISTNPELVWEEAENAKAYRLQLGTSSDFDFSTTWLDKTINDTSYTVSDFPLDNDESYHWRVKSINRDLEADWSETWSFETAASPPGVVTLASPLGPDLEAAETVTFTWEPESSATEYEFQLSQQQDFSSLVVDSVTTDTLLDISSLQDGQDYWWRVRAVNDAGTGPYSDVASFTYMFVETLPDKITLISPQDAEVDVPTTADLVWNGDEQATAYQLQVSQSSAFVSLSVDSSLTDTIARVEGLKNETVYYWRVRGTNADDEGVWSDLRTFETAAISADFTVNTAQEVDPAEGGTIADTETGASVNIPAGALTQNTTIEAGMYNSIPEGAELAGPLAYFGPPGTTFSEPVEITVPYDPNNLPEGVNNEEDLKVLRFNETDETWEELPTTVDTQNNLLTGTTDHFSGFGSGALPEEFNAPENVTADAIVSFGDASSSQDFRLVALPGAISEPLGSVFSGSHEVDWQAFWDDGSEQDYLIRYDGSSIFTLKSGNGFWATGKQAFQYSETIDMVDFNNQNQVAIPLHEGWNIVSNPLDIDVDWSDVESANGTTLQPIWGFEGSFADTTRFPSAVDGQAFYFLNDQGLDSLRIPYKQASGTDIPAGKSNTGRTKSLHLSTRVEGVQTSVSELVFSRESRSDVVAPPSGFEKTSLRFVAEDGQQASDRTSRLARIYRPLNPDGQRFDLQLLAEPDRPVVVNVAGWNRHITSDLVLLDKETGRQYDLTTGTEVTIVPERETTALLLVAGSADFVKQQKQEFLPQKVKVNPNYPNPFNPTTTLQFALPEQAEVRVQVYDILGRRVSTLINDEVREAGIHKVTFDASRWSSGMYFAVFEIGSQRFVQKMTLIK